MSEQNGVYTRDEFERDRMGDTGERQRLTGTRSMTDNRLDTNRRYQTDALFHHLVERLARYAADQVGKAGVNSGYQHAVSAAREAVLAWVAMTGTQHHVLNVLDQSYVTDQPTCGCVLVDGYLVQRGPLCKQFHG